MTPIQPALAAALLAAFTLAAQAAEISKPQINEPLGDAAVTRAPEGTDSPTGNRTSGENDGQSDFPANDGIKLLSCENHQVRGYLGRRIENNTRHELLQFPLDTYLWPYANDGKMNGQWPVDEFVGKYMHASAITYRYATGDVRKSLKARMDRINMAWLTFQRPSGFCVTSRDLEKGEWDESWDIWMAKYVLLGLLEYHQLFDDPGTLDAAKKLADSFLDAHGPRRRSLGKYDGVMLESLVLLYRLTGEKRHLDGCRWIMDSKLQSEVVDELVGRSGRVDRIPECHSYVVLSCLISILDLYRLQGGPAEYLQACQIAIRDIVENRLYVTGGMGQIEYFRDNGILAGTNEDQPQEACAVAHFLALCRKLFQVTGDLEYVDLYEKALYNNGLASKHPGDSFQVSYFCPLQGHREWKRTDHTNGIPCCTCSMCREIARIPEMLWARMGETGLAVLLYNAGTTRTTIKARDGTPVDVAIEVISDFPVSGDVKIRVRPSHPVVFPLSLRVPNWCSEFHVRFDNGESQSGTPGKFLRIARSWKPSDEVSIHFDMPVRLIPGRESFPGCTSLQRGVQVLAVDARVNPHVRDLDAVRVDLSRPVQLVAEPPERLPKGWIGNQVYSSPSVSEGKVLLVPFAEAGQMSAEDQYRTWLRCDGVWQVVDDDALRFQGVGWKVDKRPDGHWGGTAHRSDCSGDAAEFTFHGTDVEVYGYAIDNQYRDRERTACRADIFLDSLFQTRVDFSAHHMQRRLFVKTGLPAAEHTLRIVCAEGGASVDYCRYRDSRSGSQDARERR